MEPSRSIAEPARRITELAPERSCAELVEAAPELLRVSTAAMPVDQVWTTTIYNQQQHISRQQHSSQICTEASSDLTSTAIPAGALVYAAGKSGNA